MTDPLLSMLLHGENPQQKNAVKSSSATVSQSALEKALGKNIDQYLDTLSFENGDPHALSLTSPQIKRAKMKQELLNEAKLNDIDEQIKCALEVLAEQGPLLLNKEDYDRLAEELQRSEVLTQNPNVEQFQDKTLQSILAISDRSMNALRSMALTLYDREEYRNSAAISTMLAVLAPNRSDYWYYAALASRHSGNNEFALKAYTAAYALDSELLGAKIFSAECLHALGRKDEALQTYAEASQAVEESRDQDRWQETLQQLKFILEHEEY